MTVEKEEHTSFGSHEAWFVAPDEVQFIFRGEFTEEQADPYLNFVYAQAERVGKPLYACYDLSAFSRTTDGARKRVIKTIRPYPYAAMAVLGTSFSTQIAANMILTAGRLVSPKHFEFPIKFLRTMVEAHAWFDQLRAERRTKREGQ